MAPTGAHPGAASGPMQPQSVPRAVGPSRSLTTSGGLEQYPVRECAVPSAHSTNRRRVFALLPRSERPRSIRGACPSHGAPNHSGRCHDDPCHRGSCRRGFGASAPCRRGPAPLVHAERDARDGTHSAPRVRAAARDGFSRPVFASTGHECFGDRDPGKRQPPAQERSHVGGPRWLRRRRRGAAPALAPSHTHSERDVPKGVFGSSR